MNDRLRTALVFAAAAAAVALFTALRAGVEFPPKVPPGAALRGNFLPLDDGRAGEPFTFAFYGDPQSGDRTHFRICEAILERGPDFAVCGGDFAHDTQDPRQWRGFLESSWRLRTSLPWAPVRGNHDQGVLYLTDLDWPGGQTWYSFDFRHAHFAVIDMEKPFGPEWPQGRWLREDLEKAKDRPFTVVLHHKAVVSSGRYFVEGYTEPLELLHPLFLETGVDISFCGHEHFYERLRLDGLTYVVSAGGGGFTRPAIEPHPASLVFAKRHHFCLVTVHATHISVTAMTPDGRVIDHFVAYPR